ncbi:unnamed protein product [Phytophthora fragariaefolia]|uniref:Unnamed protein product n=1 Tax=Phytophthora fragariaefolia TaxID=1490495 RepID=A0A9W7D4L6_9STRA|nr:unnamed protein product [Phytophthora fragariaefolia]
MLVELGIPDSGSKKEKKKKSQRSPDENSSSSSVEVIELLTPPHSPPPPKGRENQSDGPSFVDLTTSPASPRPSPLSRNGYTSAVHGEVAVDEEATVQQVILEEEEDLQLEEHDASFSFEPSESPTDEVSFSYSPSGSPPPFMFSLPPESSRAPGAVAADSESDSPEVLSPELMASARRQGFPGERKRAGAKQARRLSGRLKGLHSETTRSSAGVSSMTIESGVTMISETEAVDARTTVSSARSRTGASPSKPKKDTTIAAGKSAGSSSASGLVAVVQMERSLDSSAAGDSIRSALKNHVYNGKHLPFIVASAMNCVMPGVIKWERRENGNSYYSCAIYYDAHAFLEMMQQQRYKKLVADVRYLQTLIPNFREQARRSCQPGVDEDETSKFFVIIESMNGALIELKKQQKQKNKKSSHGVSSISASPPSISFADLQEVAFQLFMDTGAHTKFTSDLEATADYVALLTREIVVASSRVSALEDFLESVPRNKSFRVTRTGATASACANAWLRMLQVIPGVSEDKAQSLLNCFPTYGSLMRAYRDPGLSRAQKEDLVADKLHDDRIQRALSKRIYTVFCEQNPDALI